MQRLNLKKLTLSALIFASAGSVFAQKTETSYTPVKPFSGSKEFRKISFGLNVGTLVPSVVIGGSNDFTHPKYTLGYGANVRYQLTHYFALQADYLGGTVQGDNSHLLGNDQPATGRPIQAFKTSLKYALSLNGQFTFGNINWLREKNTIVPYASIGLGKAGYTVKISRVPGQDPTTQYGDGKTVKELIVPVGVGFKINVAKMINLDLGYRMQFVDGDNFDGSTYAFNPGVSSTKKDKFSYAFLGIEFALGNKAKPQLLFDNPAARTSKSLQTQIDTVKSVIDALKTDTDGDGVADIFDKEPNTPAGAPVDSHGVTKDTDGDGVPDFKDKQLITPTECQPVDADGVGKCPEPACCKAIMDSLATMKLGTGCPADYPSLSIKGTSLTKDVKAMLATVAAKLKDNPTCNITLTAYPAASKASQSKADKKLEAAQKYLVETLGITADRIATDKSIGGGDENVIDIK